MLKEGWLSPIKSLKVISKVKMTFKSRFLFKAKVKKNFETEDFHVDAA